jgi:hypothetical protein
MAHATTVNNLTMRQLYIMKDTLQSSIARTNECRTYNNINMYIFRNITLKITHIILSINICYRKD